MAKTIIITGANGNLGTATVKKMLAADYRVIGIDNSSGNLHFAEGNKNFEFRSVNLANEEDVNSFVADVIKSHEGIDAALLLASFVHKAKCRCSSLSIALTVVPNFLFLTSFAIELRTS